MSNILIEHGTVICVDEPRRVIDDGTVLVRGDRIEYVGPRAGLPADIDVSQRIDATRMAVLPGLIDCHAHAGHGLVKTLGAGSSEDWYQACATIYTRASDPAFWAAEAGLAALERLRFGVTCGVSLFGGGDTIIRTDSTDCAAGHCESVAETGIRSVLAIGHCRPPFPWTFTAWNEAGPEDRLVSFEDQLATCAALVDDWHGGAGGRIQMAVVSPTLRAEHLEVGRGEATLNEQAAQTRAARAFSRERGLLFTQDGHTTGSVQHAHEALDLLGPDALLSHSTDLTADEIAICADTGTRIAHNPSAVASIYGRCPVPELLDAGVVVGLGSDGTAPDRSSDMFRHMQQCMHYHRRHFRDAKVMPPGKVLEMATIDAARALGLDREIGSLEAGKKADIILVDLFKPHLAPGNMPLYQCVYFANGNDVDTVIVDGEILMRGGDVKSVSPAAVMASAEREAARAIERAGLEALLATPDTTWRTSHY